MCRLFLSATVLLLQTASAARQNLAQQLKSSKIKRHLASHPELPPDSEADSPDCSVNGCLDLTLFEELDDKSQGGMCMDGSQAGYHYGAPVTDEGNEVLVLYTKGGGGCETKNRCRDWLYNQGKGTSGWRNFQHDPEVPKGHRWRVQKEGSGKLSTNPDTNPSFWNAHHVRVEYCSGDGHAGTIWNPDPELHEGFYMAGHLNLRRVLQSLATRPFMKTVKKVLFYGNSAGGVSVMKNCDFVWGAFKQAGVDVYCAPESGMFVQGMWQGGEEERNPWVPPQPYPDWKAGTTYPSEAELLPECDNLLDEHVHAPEYCGAGRWQKYYISPVCAKAHPGEEALCMSAGTLYRHIAAPLMVKQDQFDTSPLATYRWDKCNDGDDEQGREYLRRWGAAGTATLEYVPKPNDGVWFTSCLNHAGHSARPNNYELSYDEVLLKWFNDEPGDYRHFDSCTAEGDGLPCNPECVNLGADCCTMEVITLCVDSFEETQEDCMLCLESQQSKLIKAECDPADFESICLEAREGGLGR